MLKRDPPTVMVTGLLCTRRLALRVGEVEARFRAALLLAFVQPIPAVDLFCPAAGAGALGEAFAAGPKMFPESKKTDKATQVSGLIALFDTDCLPKNHLP
jgi:hypothetical protein